MAEPEFIEEKGAVMIIVPALYGLKSAGASWRGLLSTTIEEMVFQP